MSDSLSASENSGTEPGPQPRPCKACGTPLEKRPHESEKAFQKRKTCGCRFQGRGERPGAKSRRVSRYGAGYIGETQYLAELCCERRAAHDKVELPLRFWDQGPWKKFFLWQVRLASSLLKKFPSEAIITALHSPEGRNTFSLQAPWLLPLIEQATDDLRAATVESAPVESDEVAPYSPPPVVRPPSLLSRLRDDCGQG